MSDPVIAGPAARILAEATIVRVATVDPQGVPHVAPFWFSFDGELIVLDTLENMTVANMRHDPRVSVLADLGGVFDQLRGTTISGTTRLFTPDTAPAAVLAGVDRIRDKHAGEIASAAFARYLARENRPQVYVEITPARSNWWDLASTPPLSER
jgi:hypothetical protein